MVAVKTDRFLAKMLRNEYHAFFEEFWEEMAAEKLVDTWYIKRLCKEVQIGSERVFENLHKLYDLIWNCPPGTSKSSVVSIAWQPWAWTRMPSCRFITGSYSERLALDLSRKSRDIVKSEKYRKLFPEIQLREDQDTKGYFANTLGGMRFATGVGGSVLGMHAHCIAIDDAVDPMGALSDAILAESNLWVSETLSRRKVNVMLTFMCMIQQRLHQDDTTGHYINKKLPVKHFVVPCDITWEIQPPELKNEYKDGLLDPIRLSKEALEQAEKDLGPAGYACQYGQTPIPRGTAKFDVKLFSFHNKLPKQWKKRPIRYWDNAATLRGGAFTVGVLAGLDMDDNFWVIDVQRFQLNSGARERRKLEVAQKDGKNTRIFEEQEPAGSGKEVAENNMNRMALKGYTCLADRVTGDKELRSDPLSVCVNTGHCILMLAPWNKEFIEEFKFFPKSKYKDQVDAASGAFAMQTQRRRAKIGAF